MHTHIHTPPNGARKLFSPDANKTLPRKGPLTLPTKRKIYERAEIAFHAFLSLSLASKKPRPFRAREKKKEVELAVSFQTFIPLFLDLAQSLARQCRSVAFYLDRGVGAASVFVSIFARARIDPGHSEIGEV